MKKIFLILFYIRIITHLNGQNVQSLIPYIPTSPQAEAFQQYGEYAINYSTGVPDISIPLYEINHRGYKIPLFLKYFPQPLNPGYNYDVFGHGWNLSVSSCVSRSIESWPDELKDFKIETQIFSAYYQQLPNCFSDYNLVHDKFKAVLPDGSSFDFIIDKVDGVIVYTVSNGRQVKISFGCNSLTITSFTIFDEAGVKYTFSEGDRPFWGPYTSFFSNYVSWQLTRIDLPYSTEPIILNYDNGIESEYGTICEEPKILIAHRLIKGCDNHPEEYVCTPIPNYEPHYYRMKLLSSITYSNTSILLSYTDQSQMPAYNYVNKMEVFENSSLIRDISLVMVMKNLRAGCYGKVLPLAKLDKISIKGFNPSEIPQEYKCEYGIIPYSFDGTDHWGYCNFGNHEEVSNFKLFIEYDLAYIFPAVIPARVSVLEKTAGDINPYHKIMLSTIDYDNRQPCGPNYHGILTRLKYPTGGYTEFEFENHKFLTSTNDDGSYIYNPENKIEAYAGGFRIKTIASYTDDGIVANIKKYRYGEINSNNLHTGLGEVVVDPNILTYMDYTTQGLNFPLRYMVLGLDENGEYTSFTSPFEDPYYTYYDGEYTWDCAFSASNFRKLLSGRPSVIYPEVTVYYGDIGGDFDYTPEKTNGKTVYKYDITDPNTGEPFFELPQYYGNALSYEPKSYLYNNLMEQRDYRFDGQGFKLAKKERYNRYAPRCFASMDYQYNNNAYSYLYCYSDWNTAIVNAFIVGRKNNLGISLVQSKETTTYYSDNDSINITECYEYNNRNQMNYKFFLNSDNKFIKETYIYPEINNGGSTPAIIQNMVNKNIISSIIQTTTSTGNDFNFLNEIVGYKTEFKEFTSGNSTIIMPAQSYELEFKPTGNEYVLKEEIISYSSNGNPLEFISRDGIHNSYIWGYNDTYPVIKAENLTIAQLNSLVSTSLSGTGFSSLETLLNSITSFPNTSWNTFNQNLRNNASTAMITTYTYKPLIGMTSVTDPSGNATYYEYDSFGRLQYVRERDGNIIQQYKYHYKE